MIRIAVLAVAAAALAMGAAWMTAATPGGPGPGWTAIDADGHSRLVGEVAQVRDVRAIEISLQTLPVSAGPGDALFLFPSYRSATAAEQQAIIAYVERGGLLVIAADGAPATSWLAAFGVPLQGFPTLLPSGANLTCVPVEVRTPTLQTPCLPSPTAFVDTTEALSSLGEDLDVHRSVVPLVLDLDKDGRHGSHDQGPSELIVAASWTRGEGRVVAIADGDLFRDDILPARPENLAFALSLLPSGDGRVYVDSTSFQQAGWHALTDPYYRALLADPMLAFSGVALGVASAALVAPRVRAWKAHRSNVGHEDPEQQRIILDALRTTPSNDTQPKDPVNQP